MNKLIKIEVAYAMPDKQCILTVEVVAETTIEMAIISSGILTRFPGIRLQTAGVGVFGKRRQLSDAVQDGDRIEIYRPLMIDPKDARRAKAVKQKKRGA
jgi:putative ubiquitin-RnfH superfamily antitoxin RatB of RatAB toxin-antitoxin module